MATRTRRLAIHSAAAATADTVVYTCPADKTAIIKQVAFQNASGGSQVMTWLLRSAGITMQVLAVTLADGAVSQTPGLFFVLHPGDELRVRCSSAGGTIRASAHGSQLAGAPI